MLLVGRRLARLRLQNATRPRQLQRVAPMSTFNLAVANTTSTSDTIPVHLPAGTGLTQSELESFPAFKTWFATLQHSLSLQHTSKTHPFHSEPYRLRSVTIQSADRFGDAARLGFVKLAVDVRNAAGGHLPGSVFLRGGAVAMLVILQPDDIPAGTQTDKHVLMTVQPRIPAGSLAFVELPAGMIDDAGSFSGAAAREIEEELGLVIPKEELVDMTALALQGEKDEEEDEEEGERLQNGIYTSAGGQDEFVAVFLHEKRVPRRQLSEWTGKLTGLRDEGEKITLRCVRLEDLWKVGARDSKALGAWALYEGLRREGKL